MGMENPVSGPTVKAELVVPAPVSVTEALLVRVMEPVMPPLNMIEISVKLRPLNCGHTRFPLNSVGPLSVEQVTSIVDADAVRTGRANTKISLQIERMMILQKLRST